MKGEEKEVGSATLLHTLRGRMARTPRGLIARPARMKDTIRQQQICHSRLVAQWNTLKARVRDAVFFHVVVA